MPFQNFYFEILKFQHVNLPAKIRLLYVLAEKLFKRKSLSLLEQERLKNVLDVIVAAEDIVEEANNINCSENIQESAEIVGHRAYRLLYASI